MTAMSSLSDPVGAEPDAATEKALASAQRRRNWVLIGVGAVILSGLLVVAVGLLVFLLYRWGSGRPGR
jgi:hypothetical protein